MRYVCQATAIAVLSFLAASEARAQDVSGLSIGNYQFVSEQRFSRTHSYVTYRADLINTGPARDALTATVTSLTTIAEVVSGQSNLRFPPVPAGGRVTSTNTFTILVDRSVTWDFAYLKWSFLVPRAIPGPNQTVRIGDTVTLNASGSTNPSGAGALSYRWSFQSRPYGTAATLIGADTVIARFVVDVPGEYVVLLTVNNGLGSDSAIVTVSTSNSPPIASAGANSTAGIGTTVRLNGAGSSDVDGDPLTYEWTMVSSPLNSAAFLTGATTVSPTFVPDKPGTYVIQLVVRDGKVNSAPATVQVATTNTPPVAKAGSNQAVNAGAVVQLNGSGSTDVDGDPITYRWTFNSVPAGSTAAFSNPAAVNPTFTANAPGTYSVQLIVNDGFADSAASTVSITTNTIQAPTANAGQNQTVRHGELVLLTGSGTDPQSLPLTYHWSMTTRPAASSAAISSATNPRPTFTADVPGQYVVQLIVNNGYINSPAATVKITTTNTAPVAVAGSDQIGPVGVTVNLDGGSSSDADGDQLTYQWSLIAKPTNSTAALNGANTRTPTFVPDLSGTFVAQLIVNDGFANSPPATVTITVGVRAITLSPSPLNIPRSSMGTLTVTLGSPAGTGGLEVKLASSDGGVAGVPPTVVIPQGQTTATVSVTAGATGSALIIASSTGYSPGSVTVYVTTPAITLALDASTIGVTATTTATVTLSIPAPSGGILVSILANPSGVVTVPATVSVAPLATTATFPVSGAGIGSATITASIPGYTTGAAGVTVTNLGGIKLAANVTVGPNQSAPLGINLLTPAPVNGARITLNSSATTIATVPPSVFIPPGATQPEQPVQVTGVGFGSAVITATAPGFDGDSQTVRVTAKLSITPASVTIGAGGSNNLTLNLSAPAPAGLTVNVSSDNTAIASVPASITFAPNATSATISVFAVAAGSTTIRASALPHLVETTAAVTVAVLGSINLPQNATVALGQTAPYVVSLSTPAPAGGTNIALSSSDPAKVSISPSTVHVDPGQTTPAAQPQITGLAPGMVTINASAAAYGTAAASVTVTGGLSFSPSIVTVQAGATQSVSVNVPVPTVAPVVVTLSSDNTSVATVPPSITIPANALGATLNVTGVATGSTKIRASTPGMTAAEATVNVQTSGVINLPANVSVSLGGNGPFAITLAQPAAAKVTIALTSSDANKVSLSAQSVTIEAGQSAPAAQPQVTGAGVGTATITAAAAGYTQATQTVRVSATVSFVPSSLTISGVATQNVTLKLSATTAAAVTLNLSSDNSGVATVPATATIAANTDSATVPVTSVAVGSTVVHATLASHIPDATANVSVSAAGAVGVPANTSVALGASVPFPVSLPAAATADVVLALASNDAGKVAVSPSAVTILKGATTPASQPQVTGVSIGSAAVTVNAPGYTQASGNVNVTASLNFSPATLNVSKGTAQNLMLNLSAVTPAAVVVSLVSDNPAIASVPASATIPANSLGVNVAVTGIDAGATVIRATGPAGVSGATANVTVGSDIILPAEVNVAPGEQVMMPLSLAKPATDTIFVQLSISDSSKATLQQNLVTIQPGQTQPAAPPRINGVDFGTATITASAEGFAPAVSTVRVGAKLTFGSSSLTLGPSTTHTLGISLSSSAPANGVVVNLISSNPGVATVPASVTIAGGQSGILVQLKALTIGTATITASSPVPTVTPATLNVTVASPGVLTLPASFVVAMGDSVGYPVALSSPAGAGGVTVNLDATAPNISFVPLVCISTPCPPVPSNATHTSVFISEGQTTPSSLPEIRGVTPGQVTVTATASGYASATGTVRTTASFAFSQATLNLNPGATGTLFRVLSGRAPPPPTGLTVTLNSSNPDVATVQASVPAFWDGSSPTTLNIAIQGVAAGSTTIRASAPNMTDATTTVTVSGPLTISSTSLPAGIVGRAYSTTVAAGGGKLPYHWSATGLPAGLGIAQDTGVISGTPTAAGSGPVTITLTDSTTPTAQTTSKTLTLAVAPALAIETGSLPGGVVGAAYSATLTQANGIAPFTWSASGLPGGLTLNPSTGAITGNPTAAGTTQVSITLTDSTAPPQTAAKTLSITVSAGLSITNASLPSGVVNTSYSAQLTASGGSGPYTWAATGLPGGLNLNTTSGAITGSPTGVGTSQVSITVTDSTNPVHLTATANLAITVSAGLAITTASIPGAVVGAPYSAALAVAGGVAPFTWSANGLPAGLSINPQTGAITGTPTAAVPAASIAVSVTDSTAPAAQTASKTYSIVVQPALVITTSSLPAGSVGQAYTATLAGAGGNTPYTWSATGLPSGLTMNPATGVISGTPGSASTNTVVVTLTDSTQPVALTKTANLSITVVGAVSITTSSLPSGFVGLAYNAALNATGGTPPYTWAAMGLPSGLSINSNSGAITGNPTVAGPSTVQITATDSTNPTKLIATASLSLTIAPGVSITTATLNSGTVGTPYGATVAATGGTAPYTWGAANLPGGLNINPTTGAITGSPTVAGSATVTFTATDSTTPTHLSASKDITIVVAPALAVTNSSLPAGAVGSPYSAALAATGGNSPYTWAATGLPDGLTLNTASGAITGTPTAAATSTVSVTVTDSTAPTKATASRSLSVAVVPALSITTASLPAGVVSLAYNATVAATGGNAPYTWSATGLPAGLNIDPGTGAITGTPTAGGTTTASITVTDSTNPVLSATKPLSITIAPALTITTTSLPNGSMNAPYTAPVAATGAVSPYTWSATGLPPGLSISSGSGAISGTPTATFSGNVAVTAKDSSSPVQASTTKNLALTIGPPVPASVAPTFGSGQSTVVLTLFGSQLQVSVKDASNQPVSGVAVTFTAPDNGASLSFGTGGSTATVNTTTAGLATSPQMTANGTAGTYSVSATVAGLAPVVFSLTNTAQSGLGQITVTNASVGKNLQSMISIVLPAPAGDGGVSVTVSSANFNKVLLGGNARESTQVTIPAGQNQVAILVHALDGIGTVNVTASATGYLTGTGVITLTQSAFVLAGPNDVGATFDTFVGVNTTLTVYSARLDASNKYVEKQPLRSSFGSSVIVSLSSSAAGSVTPTSVTFNPGDAGAQTTFRGVSQGTASVGAAVPSGFTLPSDGSNTLNIAVLASALIMPANLTIGRNLQTAAAIGLNGVAPSAGLPLTLTSSDGKLRFSESPTAAGTSTLTLNLPALARGTNDFYIQALEGTGSATFSAQAPGFGSATATVTLTPSGIVFTNAFGGVPNQILAAAGGNAVTVSIYSARLNSSGAWVQTQALAGGTSATVNVTNTGSASVGSVSPVQVTIQGGSIGATTQFIPGSQGTTSLAVSVPASPAGFATPDATYRTLPVSVTTSRIVLTADGLWVGKDLQVEGSIVLNAAAPAGGLPVTITSSSPQMLLSDSATTAGQPSIVVTVPAGTNSAKYYVQALGASGPGAYTATASGYANGTASIEMTPSGVVLSSDFGLPFVTIPSGTNTAAVLVNMAQLDPVSNAYVETQPLRGGLTLNVAVRTENTGVATVTSPVTIEGGADPLITNATLTRAGTGTTSLRVDQPAGFVAATNTVMAFKPMPVISVNVQ